MSVMDDLLKDVNRLTQTVAEPQLSFYSCQACGDTYRSEKMLEACPGCKAAARQWPGSTADEARGRAKRAAGVSPATTLMPDQRINPSEVSNANPPTPQQTGVSAGETKDTTAGLLGTTGADTPAEQPKPRAKRTVAKKTEVAPVVEATASNQPATDAEVDYRAQREARVAAFIEKHNLNEFQPVPVGTATVQTVGYTLWVGGKPIFRLKESFETGREFAADYNAARAEQPATRIDVAACNKVSDSELELCLFKGDLIVSLNSGHGTEQVKVGDVINIGAYRTKENRLRFAII